MESVKLVNSAQIDNFTILDLNSETGEGFSTNGDHRVLMKGTLWKWTTGSEYLTYLCYDTDTYTIRVLQCYRFPLIVLVYSTWSQNVLRCFMLPSRVAPACFFYNISWCGFLARFRPGNTIRGLRKPFCGGISHYSGYCSSGWRKSH